METWTNMLLEQVYSEDFSSAIIKTIKKGNTAKILLLNPENKELIEMRMSQFRDDEVIDIKGNIYQNIDKLNQIKKILGRDKIGRAHV